MFEAIVGLGMIMIAVEHPVAAAVIAVVGVSCLNSKEE